jgi:hypothetical protein
MSAQPNAEPLEVAFTEQQLVLLQQVVDAGTHGRTIEEVVRNIFRQHSEQLFGTERSA